MGELSAQSDCMETENNNVHQFSFTTDMEQRKLKGEMEKDTSPVL